MPQNPGNFTMTFTPPGQFTADRLHTVGASQGLAAFQQPGCARQTATTKDKVTDTTYAEANCKIITPWNPSTAAVTAEWYVSDGIANYRVLGRHGTPDRWGNVNHISHITFLCKEELG